MTSSQSKQVGPNLRKKIKKNWKKLSERDIASAGISVKALSAVIQRVYGRDKNTVDRDIVDFRQGLAVERQRNRTVWE